MLLGCAGGIARRDTSTPAQATVAIPAELADTCALEPPEHFAFDRAHAHRGCMAELSSAPANAPASDEHTLPQ